MAEATLPQIDQSDETGFKNANIEKIRSRPLELTGKSVELLGSGIEKTASVIIEPLLTTLFGSNMITSMISDGLGKMGSLINFGGTKLNERGRAVSSTETNNTTNNKTVEQSNNTNNKTVELSTRTESIPATIKILNQSDSSTSAAQQNSISAGGVTNDSVSPLPSLLHPDMRRAARMPMVIRNAAMLSRAVQKKTSDMDDSDEDGDAGEQMQLIKEAQKESTFEIIEAVDNQTSMTLEKQEELQPTFLERRQETQLNKKALEEQQKTNKLLTQQNKIKATENKDGGFLSGIMDNMRGVIGGITGFFAAGGGLSKLFSFIPSLVKKFAVFGLLFSAIEGILDGFRVFQEGGSIGEIIMATIEGFADSVIQIFTFGLLDLEKIQNAVTDGIEWTVNLVKELWENLTRGFDKIIGFLTFGLVDFKDVGNAVSFVIDSMTTGFGFIVDYLKFSFGFLKDLFTGNFEGVFDRVKTVFGILGNGFKWIGDRITSFFGNLGEIIATVFNLSPLGIAFNFIKKTFEKIPQVAERLFNSVIDFAKKVLPDWVVNKIFGNKEPTEEEMAQEARTREANKRATTILDEYTQKTKNPNDLTIADLDRSLQINSTPEPVGRENRTRRVSENINQTNRIQPKIQPKVFQIESRATVETTTDKSQNQIIQSNNLSESEKLESLFAAEFNEKEMEMMRSMVDNSAMRDRAVNRAAQTETLSDQVRSGKQTVANSKERQNLNNMNQIINNQSYQTNVTRLRPRDEDFNAGAINRETDY